MSEFESDSTDDRCAVVFLGTASETHEIAAFLTVSGISAEPRQTDIGWVVLTHEADRAASAMIIKTYLDSIYTDSIVKSDNDEHRFTFVVAFCLVAIFSITGPFDPGRIWFILGSLNRKALLDGEVWRAVTSLTLHADAAHLVGNMFALSVLAFFICRLLGVGKGWLLILFSGILGNIARMSLHDIGYALIGASTSVFGAVGLAGGIEYQRRLRYQKKDAWVPLATTVVILTLLGAGGNDSTDVLAHFYGLVSGISLSLFTRPGKEQNRKKDKAMKWMFCGIILASWLLAFLS